MTTTTTTPKKSLFAAAKKVEVKKAKEDKQVITLAENRHPDISRQLARLEQLRLQVDEITAESKMLEGIIKPIARDTFLHLYRQERSRPESFIIKGEQGGSFMVLFTDKYPKLDEARFNELSGKYGQQIAEKKTAYGFDDVLLAKYETVLSDLIMGSPDIDEADKPDLITAKEEYHICKGTIDRLAQYGEKIEEVFHAIEPVLQLKNTGNKQV